MKKTLNVSEAGSMGGKARAKKLSKQQLSESGTKAVNARWAKRPRKGGKEGK